MAEKPSYLLGTDEKQKWMQKYFFAPKGFGFTEPGIVALDSKEMSAYNVAKSTYQIHPDVFNMDRVTKLAKVSRADAMKRIQRMYDDRIFMLVQNPAVQVCGWGLWYWMVKLKADATPQQKKELSDWFQNKDDICTGYPMANGDFDFFNGNHMRVLDNLLADVIGPWKDNECVEYVHLCPIERDIRESSVNQWDAPDGNAAPGYGYRKFAFTDEMASRLMKVQKKIDATDWAIINAINSSPSIGDMFDFGRIAELSGLNAAEMKKDLQEIVDSKRIILPMLHLNFEALGLTQRFLAIRLFQIIPSCRKLEIFDELTAMPEWVNIWEFGSSFHDAMFTAYNELCDVDALVKKIEGYAEVEEVLQANSSSMFRRWVCRLDDSNGYWEECVMTDDFLQDRTIDDPAKCVLSRGVK